MKGVLVDTGPLVAIFSGRDSGHQVCVQQLQELTPPLLTCWPVVTEAAWLLRNQLSGLRALLGSFDTGLLQLLPLEQSAFAPLSRFMQRYREIGAQLADAALVYLAGQHGIEVVFTLDRRDFNVYRTLDNRRLRIIPD